LDNNQSPQRNPRGLSESPPAVGDLSNCCCLEPLRIGIIGSGQIGGTIGKRWAEAGHQILFTSRNLDELAPLVAAAGPNARAGSVA
jgi:hypothetical protein